MVQLSPRSLEGQGGHSGWFQLGVHLLDDRGPATTEQQRQGGRDGGDWTRSFFELEVLGDTNCL